MKNKNVVFPNYDKCILNLITSIIKHYGVETKYSGLADVDKILENNYENIVLIVLDGMGSNLLKNVSFDSFFMKNKIDDITSVYPSTTVAAMNTYYSGKPPIETGWIGWSQYFKEYGRAIDVFKESDSYTEEKYPDAKINILDLIDYKSIFEKIEESTNNKVKAYEINPTKCSNRSNRTIKADSIEYMCEDIESICNNKDKNFILAYSDYPDYILHREGCNSEEVKKFIINAEKTIEKLCEKLQNTNTLVLISADHGHNDIEKTYNILELQDINECLIMPPSLESRAVSFWVKDNKKEEFEKIFNFKFKDEFILFTKKEFLEKHFLGYGNMHKKIDDFIGNYMAVSIGNSIIKLGTHISKDKYEKASTHCGLTPNEMIVPLIVKDLCK